MRLLFVVQRYGREVAGGAEAHCRQFATRLAARGHQVEVLTSAALSYVDWANWFPVGTAELDGVVVHRLAVDEPRNERFFTPLNDRVLWSLSPVPLHMQEEWMRSQGPCLSELGPWLQQEGPAFDVVIFFTYLYYTTSAGLRAVAGLVPTVFHPTAHDEPPLYLGLFDTVFRQPSGFAFSTPEEAALVKARFGLRRPSSVVGIGFDADVEGDGSRFRATSAVAERPYLVYVGRVDPGKGSLEVFDHFVAYKRRNPGPLALVVIGDPVRPLAEHPDVIVAGFVDEQAKHDAIAGSLALVQPSYFESFSMVLVEAWLHSKPALVQGYCDVLVGQSRRSGGGIWYRGFAEFEAAVDLLTGDADLRRAMGAAGRRYVVDQYRWEAVLQRYERFLGTVARHRRPSASARPL
jgi:glycosyltransferase involved in cell wall biosynthesis